MNGVARVEFRILGRLEVLDGGRSLDLGGHRQRALLAFLTLSATRVVSIERLIDGLWGDDPPPQVLGTLHAYISRLRRILEPRRPGRSSAEVLVTRSPGYILDVAAEQVDVLRFERLADDGHAALARRDPEGAARLLATALDLWRGAALAEFAGEPFARADAVRLEERRLAAVEERMEAELALGRHRLVVAELESLVAEHPLRERLWGLVMLALYRSGRQAEALRAYQRARNVLAEDLGLDPGPALRALEQAVVRQDPELDVTPLVPGSSPAGKAAPSEPEVRHNLPAPLTSFVGRERELDELGGLLRASRLVTLTGPGGAGKTRLALEAAFRALPSFPDGVVLVELAPLSDASLVARQVVTTLGLGPDHLAAPGDAVVEALTRHLRPQQVLLVLDNCEQVVTGASALCRTLLQKCPNLTVLATSRECLALAGEVVWPVPPLSLPPAAPDGAGCVGDSDAVALFAERARLTDPTFELTRENTPAVLQICRRLDGLPLALELAASRLRVLSVTQIAQRLDDRFRLLTGGPGHSRTLEASIDWSYDLLSEAERRLLERLAVFPAGFDLAAVDAIAADGQVLAPGDILDLLTGLVDKSLVTRESGGDEVRYHLLETIRSYAARKLAERGDGQATLRRHRDFFLARATRHGLHAVDHPGEWMQTLGADHENFRAALEWSFAAGEADEALRLAAGLSTYCQFGGHFLDGRAWLERALALTAAPAGDTRVAALNGLGFLVLQQGEPGRAIALHEEARALARSIGDDGGEGMACLFLGARALQQAEMAEAARLFVDAHLAFAAIGAEGGVGWCEFHLGWVDVARGDHDGARARFDAVLDRGRRSGRDDLVAHAAAALAPVAASSGDAGEAQALAGEAVRTAQRLGLRHVLIMALTRAAETFVLLGDHDHAGASLRESLELLGPASGDAWLADSLELAAMVGSDANSEAGARLLAVSRAVREASGGTARTGPVCRALALCERRVAAAVGPRAFSKLCAEARARSRTDALAEAVAALPRPLQAPYKSAATATRQPLLRTGW